MASEIEFALKKIQPKDIRMKVARIFMALKNLFFGRDALSHFLLEA